MISRFVLLLSLVASVALGATAPTNQTVVVQPREDTDIVLDATVKEYTAKPGEESCTFKFGVTNTSKHAVTIVQVRTSCGCTVAKLPSQPWHLGAGESGTIELVVDLRGKSGTFIKSATIDLPTTYKKLLIKVTMPDATATMSALDREHNQAIAKTDRQRVFKGDCAKCHVEPTVGLQGAALFSAACGICHEATNRASMVPDLHAVKNPTDAKFWRTIITDGRPNTLMPAFAASNGGPLSSDQIDSLVAYLTARAAK